jgi:phospholipid/cholesterol/gamma-HCH transport system substrate-binding protein
MESLSETLVNMSKLTGDLAAGKGSLGRLLYDEQLAGKLDSLGSAIDDFSSIVHSLANREGALGELLAEGGSAELALADMRDAAAAMKQLATRLESDEGFVGRLLNDSEYSEGLARDLESTLRNTADITGKIASGEGSLGALVNERGLYEGAEDVAAGVNDSKFARWLTRHYRKKGIEAAEDQEDQPAGPDPPLDDGAP